MNNAESVSAIVNGLPTATTGRPPHNVRLDVIASGQTLELRFLLKEPTTPSATRVPIPPLIDNAEPPRVSPQAPVMSRTRIFVRRTRVLRPGEVRERGQTAIRGGS